MNEHMHEMTVYECVQNPKEMKEVLLFLSYLQTV